MLLSQAGILPAFFLVWLSGDHRLLHLEEPRQNVVPVEAKGLLRGAEEESTTLFPARCILSGNAVQN